MRLDWLRIPKHRNLRNFEIDFDKSQPTTVLLGRNGSGKSNLIEAIIEIFRELDSVAPASFAYTMKYTCYGQTVEVDADPKRLSRRLLVTVDGRLWSATEFRTKKEKVLPQYVFAYYSGWSSRLEKLFEVPTRSHYQQLLRNPDDDMPLRRFFFCRKDYSQLVLLAFFLADDPSARKLLLDYLEIEGFESALFVLKTPWWGENKKSSRNTEESDSRFWNAKGAFRPFLRMLWENSLAPIRNRESVTRDIRRDGERTERLYLFIKDEAQLNALRRPFETPKLLFGNLESLFLCDLIDEVRVKVRKKDGSVVTFTQLSEGEQQLLTVLGLLRFTQDDESLYLLDEPDTHLNPVWTYDFLKLLQENIRAAQGQLLIATHNPLMIGTLHSNEVRVLSQEENATTACAPEYDPIGIGVEGLLKSELYGLRSTLAPEILDLLDEHYKLLGKPNKSSDEELELINLASQLNELGVARTHPNPYFEQFANAMARQSPEMETNLTKEEIEAQTKLADEVLAEIFAEEKLEEEQKQ